MTVPYIVLMILGISLVIISFLVDNRADAVNDEEILKRINEITENNKSVIEVKINEILDSKIESAKEKTEAQLDKISNEKMLEFGDYSQTVLNEINKNHNEAVFLYDMLNEKSKEIKNVSFKQKRITDINMQDNLNSQISIDIPLKQSNKNTRSNEEKHSKDLAKERLEQLVKNRPEARVVRENKKAANVVSVDNSDIKANDVISNIGNDETDNSIVNNKNSINNFNKTNSDKTNIDNANSNKVNTDKANIDNANSNKVNTNKTTTNKYDTTTKNSSKNNRKHNSKRNNNETKNNNDLNNSDLNNNISNNVVSKNDVLKSDLNNKPTKKLSRNERILQMYSQGLSKNEIARKLGMGRNEVSLVIDMKKRK